MIDGEKRFRLSCSKSHEKHSLNKNSASITSSKFESRASQILDMFREEEIFCMAKRAMFFYCYIRQTTCFLLDLFALERNYLFFLDYLELGTTNAFGCTFVGHAS